jgi:hypothetical protein
MEISDTKSEETGIFTFSTSTEDNSCKNIYFTGKIHPFLGPSVVSESFAAQFPLDKIDRTSRQRTKMAISEIQSTGEIEIRFRVVEGKKHFSTRFHIWPDQFVNYGGPVYDAKDSSQFDALIGGKAAERMGLITFKKDLQNHFDVNINMRQSKPDIMSLNAGDYFGIVASRSKDDTTMHITACLGVKATNKISANLLGWVESSRLTLDTGEMAKSTDQNVDIWLTKDTIEALCGNQYQGEVVSFEPLFG